MPLVYCFVGAVLLLGVCVWAAYRLGFSASEQSLPALAEEIADKKRQEDRESLEFATRRWGDSEIRLESLQKAIVGILKERDDWVRLYSEQSIAHGNAQTLMMDWIERQRFQLKKLGHELSTPAVITQVRDDFLTEHVNPTLERTGTPTIHRGPPTPIVTEIASSAKLDGDRGVTQNVRG